MEVLLFVLGVFGLIPVAMMGLFYTVIPLLLVGLQVLGVAEALRERSAPRRVSVPAPAPSLDEAA